MQKSDVPTGSLTIKGFETDLAGNKTHEFVHATSPKDVEACIEEAARVSKVAPGASRT